uniref:Ribosomal protein small subunit 14 n=1 Tax=Paramoeba pemaquidensis TaxID=180228 RepID=A0A1D8DB68_9EUKA|nr:ribosomal protein small subunit 14 [Paramoeba pemaquidensis]AOS85531.1 ribosomal protein small subunit 14 [Paramoeba pemaquidensis]
MKKFFFYKKKSKALKKTNKNELNTLVKKLIKIKFIKQTFSMNFNNKVLKNNFCIETGHNRSVNSFYYLSRMCLKEQFRKSLVNGLRKISW